MQRQWGRFLRSMDWRGEYSLYWSLSTGWHNDFHEDWSWETCCRWKTLRRWACPHIIHFVPDHRAKISTDGSEQRLLMTRSGKATWGFPFGSIDNRRKTPIQSIASTNTERLFNLWNGCWCIRVKRGENFDLHQIAFPWEGDQTWDFDFFEIDYLENHSFEC